MTQKMTVRSSVVCRDKWNLINVDYHVHQCLFWKRIGYGIGCVLKLPRDLYGALARQQASGKHTVFLFVRT